MKRLFHDGGHGAKFLKQAWSCSKVVHRATPVSGVLGARTFLGGAFPCATVGKGNVNAPFTVDVKVVEIKQVAI